jgi:TM2 domain-containing membrane protein YozV
LAFLLSLLVPGAGQFYCGKTTRGGFTLGFWILGAILSFGASGSIQGIGINLIFTLWVFALLDAYFTAAELNAGVDLEAQNPRVAVALNLLTNGFGYFYLGERTKGLVLVIGMRFVAGLVQALTIRVPALAPILLTAAALAFGLDAYRIAKKQLVASVDPEAQARCQAAVKASRLPAFVPVTLATLAVSGALAMVVFGSFIMARKAKTGQQPQIEMLDQR